MAETLKETVKILHTAVEGYLDREIRDLREHIKRLEVKAETQETLRFKHFGPLEGRENTDWFLEGKSKENEDSGFNLIEGIMYRSSLPGRSNNGYEEYFESRSDCEHFAASLKMVAVFVKEKSNEQTIKEVKTTHGENQEHQKDGVQKQE